MPDVWIINASPLILFARINQLELFEKLALQIYIPSAVIEEVREGREKHVFTERDQKLEAAREARKQKRLAEKQQPVQHHIHVDGKNINSLTQQGRFSISN